ncbi:MAG: SDR family oxidoreductase [Magnetospirillum sp.]|nr:SDR family oxidoreductase [Magnetospirillum sp.]
MSDIISSAIPRVALVTGAARRIGRAVALDLAQAGFHVAVHCSHSTDDAEAVADQIRQLGRKAVVLVADLSCEDDAQALLARAEAALGPVGVLVNNASTFERDEALSVTRDSWDFHMEVNLRAPFVLIQELARRLPPAAEAVAVNLLDQRVWNLTPHFTSYTLSKAGLWTLTQTLALALAPRIRVVGVGPGPALPSTRQTDQQFAAQCAGTPLRRGTNPQEICRAVRFALAMPSFTGQMIALDGGQHLQWAPGGAVTEE